MDSFFKNDRYKMDRLMDTYLQRTLYVSSFLVKLDILIMNRVETSGF